jgi:hypothetical protein
MVGAQSRSRLRGALLGVAAALSLAIALALCTLGVALLIAGIGSWLHPGDVAAAWARTLVAIGLIGAAACLAALGWPGIGWLRIGVRAATLPPRQRRIIRAFRGNCAQACAVFRPHRPGSEESP